MAFHKPIHNMQSAKELHRNLNNGVKKEMFLIVLYGYIALSLIGFLLVSKFVRSYSHALINSQNYEISIQNWRAVTNGIRGGWNFLPKLNGVCILGTDGKILDSQGDCHTTISFSDVIVGKRFEIKDQNFSINFNGSVLNKCC